jgi:hypothetical protein
MRESLEQLRERIFREDKQKEKFLLEQLEHLSYMETRTRKELGEVRWDIYLEECKRAGKKPKAYEDCEYSLERGEKPE